MRRLTLSLGIVALALVLTGQVSLAQERSACATVTEEKSCQQMGMKEPRCGMMQGEMMGKGMMCEGSCKTLHQFGGPGFYVKHTEQLELSDSQVRQLQAIWQGHKKKAIRKRAEIQIAEMELGEILRVERIDFNKARAKLSEIGSLKQEIALDHLNSIEKARKVLTTEQLSKFKTLKRKPCKGMMGMEMMKK